jgi:predicted DNA-binding transcriptional regulator YafY
VRFRYRPGVAPAEERTVDPYRVIVRSGRYYLVGYDVTRRDWRLFALDAILGLPAKAGSIRTDRPVPEAYTNTDVLGFIKDPGRAVAVTVEFSAKVAAAASRFWQRDQRIEKALRRPGSPHRVGLRSGGGGRSDGADARVVSPPAAVQAARDLAEQLLLAHDETTDR